jgi:hypothetical protein
MPPRRADGLSKLPMMSALSDNITDEGRRLLLKHSDVFADAERFGAVDLDRACRRVGILQLNEFVGSPDCAKPGAADAWFDRSVAAVKQSLGV